MDGKLASQGSVNKELLEKLLSHPFFLQPPPNLREQESSEREKPHEIYALAKEKKISPSDLMRTLLNSR